MLSEIQKINQKFSQEIRKTLTSEETEALRIHYLGRKGVLNALFVILKSLPQSERKKAGDELNLLKKQIEDALEQITIKFESNTLQGNLKQQGEDTSLPPVEFTIGKNHPINQVLDEIIEIFLSLGFAVSEGPEIETDENNFGALNIPENHPARDLHDTFYIKTAVTSNQLLVTSHSLLLRTHTSPVQIRVMKSQPPPVRIIAPGKVYRHEAIDATHSSVFHQIEGLAVDENISFVDLKGTLETFVRRFFGKDVKTRFRPSYFPFVEPGAEMDISCSLCMVSGAVKSGSRGCAVCKGTGWLEMLGAGMVHPNVFKAVGYDPEKVTGFAFGMGIERIAMIRYGITDMRLFYENHLDFLSQL